MKYYTVSKMMNDPEGAPKATFRGTASKYM